MDIISPEKLQALANASVARYRSESDMARWNKRVREDLLDDLYEQIRRLAPEGSCQKYPLDDPRHDITAGQEMTVRYALTIIENKGGMDPMKRKAIRYSEKEAAE